MIAQSFDFQVLPLGHDMLLRPLTGAAATGSPTTSKHERRMAGNAIIRGDPRLIPFACANRGLLELECRL
jgi:hypothetical protein